MTGRSVTGQNETGRGVIARARRPRASLLGLAVTLLGGPVLAYNTLSVLLPAIAALTAFLLCRHLTHSFWPSQGSIPLGIRRHGSIK